MGFTLKKRLYMGKTVMAALNLEYTWLFYKFATFYYTNVKKRVLSFGH